MGEALLLEGQKVKPSKLTQAGFEFLYPDLESALRWELGR
jgi:NAD dependent epimerase/dehydratase family enzyme